MSKPTANTQTAELISQLEQSVKVLPSTQESYKFIRHVQVNKGDQKVQAEVRLHITTDSNRFINKDF